jgi:nitrogen fixation/metabolism regulation signal transduction histidine kinase
MLSQQKCPPLSIIPTKQRINPCKQPKHNSLGTLYAQSHNRVDYIIVVLFQCLDSLLSGDACLGHDQLDVLILKTRSIDLLSIVLIIVLLVITLIDCLSFSIVMGVIVARVVVSGVVMLLLSSELLGSGSLSLGVEILDLGLTEDTLQKQSVCVVRRSGVENVYM